MRVQRSQLARPQESDFSLSPCLPPPLLSAIHLGSNARKRPGEPLQASTERSSKGASVRVCVRRVCEKHIMNFPTTNRTTSVPWPRIVNLMFPCLLQISAVLLRSKAFHARFSISPSSSRTLTTSLAKPTGHRCSKPLYLTHSRVMAPLTPVPRICRPRCVCYLASRDPLLPHRRRLHPEFVQIFGNCCNLSMRESVSLQST